MRISTITLFLLACDNTTTTPDDTPPEPFACGGETCDGDQYCANEIPGVKPDSGTVGDTHRCVDAPAGCDGVPTCACVAAEEACGVECDDAGDGVLCTLALP